MATDIMQYVVLGVVVIGGIYVYTHLSDITAGLQGGGGNGGGGAGGAGGAGGLGAPSVDCMLNPTDPTCMLSNSMDMLGVGTNSASQITKDIFSRYTAVCTRGNGCAPLVSRSSQQAKDLRQFYPDAFDMAGQYRRGSSAYNSYIDAVVKEVARVSCTACYTALGGMVSGGGASGLPCITDNACACAKCGPYDTCSACWFRKGTNNQPCIPTMPEKSAATPKRCAPVGAGGQTRHVNANCDYNAAANNYCWHEVGKTMTACALSGCNDARTKYLADWGGGGHGMMPKPPGHSGGGSFSCSPSTGACSTSGQQTCFHICDGIKKKNCVRCDTSPPLLPPPSCASVKAHVGSQGC